MHFSFHVEVGMFFVENIFFKCWFISNSYKDVNRKDK